MIDEEVIAKLPKRLLIGPWEEGRQNYWHGKKVTQVHINGLSLGPNVYLLDYLGQRNTDRSVEIWRAERYANNQDQNNTTYYVVYLLDFSQDPRDFGGWRRFVIVWEDTPGRHWRKALAEARQKMQATWDMLNAGDTPKSVLHKPATPLEAFFHKHRDDAIIRIYPIPANPAEQDGMMRYCAELQLQSSEPMLDKRVIHTIAGSPFQAFAALSDKVGNLYDEENPSLPG